MKIDDNITDYVYSLKITLNGKTFDLTDLAPGNKFWRFDSDLKNGKMYIVEGTISNVGIVWCSSRGLFIESSNETPYPFRSSEDYDYDCTVEIEDVFFNESDCIDAANKYIKENGGMENISIEKKVQPGREVWEMNLKKLDDKYGNIRTKSVTGNKSEVNLMML